jgi:hypothetical protein
MSRLGGATPAISSVAQIVIGCVIAGHGVVTLA